MSGSRMQIRKQDPSVASIGVRFTYVHSRVFHGPKDREIEIVGLPTARYDENNDFIVDPAADPERFDAVHTFAVVRQVLTMVQRALRRAGRTEPFQWQWGPERIAVRPQAGRDRNAYYSRSRRELSFYYFSHPELGKVYTCRSFDIVAHETGHAVLDALRPGYWDSWHPETGALHESFGDLLAIFTMLAQMDQCEAIIAESKADLHATSFVQAIGEQFGKALYGHDLGIRNVDQDRRMGDVGDEPHDLSLVFTGAVYDALADMFDEYQKPNQYDHAETLFRLGKHMTALTLAALTAGPERNATFRDIAERMEALEPVERWKPLIRAQFQRRGVFDDRRLLTRVDVDLDRGAACGAMRRRARHARSETRKLRRRKRPRLEELDARVEKIFLDLLAPSVAGSAVRPAASVFGFFESQDAARSLELQARLSMAATAGENVEEGLHAALDLAEGAAKVADAGVVHHALAVFLTHHPLGRRLHKPRSGHAAAFRFAPSTTGGPVAADSDGAFELVPSSASGGGSSGAEAVLDTWREDILANEHHEHWHQVWPWSGLLRDWNDVVAQNPAALVSSITAKAQSVGGSLGSLVQLLTDEEFRALFRLKDRQGETFVYMHQQMLARYDAERLSVGLPPVNALDLDAPIPEGYDPGTEVGRFYRRGQRAVAERPASTELTAGGRQALRALEQPVLDAIAAGATPGPNGSPLDPTLLGEIIEAADERFFPGWPAGTFRGLHNNGHVILSGLSSTSLGVMLDPRIAIRDPVFWRWHRRIDDLTFAWQETLPPYDFAVDAPPTVLRKRLGGPPPVGLVAPWASPDILLCRRRDVPGHDGDDFAAVARAAGEEALGGAHWDEDRSNGSFALASGATLTTSATLSTSFATRTVEIESPQAPDTDTWTGEVSYLTHEPFVFFVRAENPTPVDVEVTFRVFLAPADTAEDRRTWIEMDKFIRTLAAGSRTVVFRDDREASVIKKPAEVDPSLTPEVGQRHGEDDAICDCGWPWTLLLPRGTAGGLDCRLFVMMTDATIDQTRPHEGCGSMSFCGTLDEYPDTRDMGYPFSRPFAQSIADTIRSHDHVAATTVRIQHHP